MLSRCNMDEWPTPISNASAVEIESIESDGHLSITVKATECNAVLLVCFRFTYYHWYQIRRIETGYDLRYGRTQVHDDSRESEWDSASLLNLKAFQSTIGKIEECQLYLLSMKSRHFVIVGDSSEIDIISKSQPHISVIGRKPLRNILRLDSARTSNEIVNGETLF